MPGKIVYCSFDRFPSAKGAATHISEFVSALGETFSDVDLVTLPAATLGEDGDSIPWISKGVHHFQIPADGENLIERVQRFRRNLSRWWESRFSSAQAADKQSTAQFLDRPDIVHFRSIFEGYPIAMHKNELCRQLIFEVNGLPSIELKYHYPNVADDTEFLKKLRFQEESCFNAADKIVTVSQVNRSNLISRGCDPAKIHVIRNGVDLNQFAYSNRDFQERRFDEQNPLKAVYTGTMSAWQGVKDAIEAIALLRRDAPASLRIVGPYRINEKKSLIAWAEQHGVAPFVSIEAAVSKPELLSIYNQSDVMVAPLTRNDRNTVQGCCPLKILEAMATGIPVIASRLAVVEELAEDEKDVLLFRAGSAKSIKDAMVRVMQDPDHLSVMTENARTKVEQRFSWSHAKNSLIELYQSIQ